MVVEQFVSTMPDRLRLFKNLAKSDGETVICDDNA